MLSRIFYAFGEGFGARAGYAPDERIEDIELFPPHNPFMGLDVKLVRQRDIICGLIITGTPGIGKTLFLLYVLALRLLARQTTVLQLKKNEFIIFEAAGVFSCEKMNAGIRFLPEHTWFLVDSNREIIEPPDLFLEACFLSSRRLIVAASPREQRFAFTSKCGWIVTKWMYPFESWEYIAARHFQLTDIPPTERQLQLFFREWGPNARAAFEYAGRIQKRGYTEHRACASGRPEQYD
ncbi:uncharacterized protein FOMMEDRAFT_139750 [Fomitiporia mediterranea MF3/22]|uniref:uncharacterized protein n=1 Tax=Fomitiporia mediterranea (strain MF3/22) TaxID=694068 RepID=UPI0004408AFD|nr:uncharacterized protein FOMMEDRAFT_139750 [Fomitiporia mediterranea MF3/22]EJD05294.1 hypothetical protein FOMMEDRAFT_139750 [Fomitiporia mediterranea MF3/22]